MAYIYTSEEFIEWLRYALSQKTLYVSGCFGAPMTTQNKLRYSDNNAYNRKPERKQMIMDATSDTFGFDCNNLIKGILWGWSGVLNTAYGGANYASRGVPDLGEEALLNVCSDISTTGWDKLLPGELVWMKGHVGAYVGDGQVIESSPAWANGVQLTAIKNVPHPVGLNERVWVKHGKLPWIDYTIKEEENEMTYDQFVAFMNQYRAELAAKDPSAWTETTGEWEAAKQMGIVDEKAGRPRDFATREEVAAMIVRTVK